MFKLYEVNVSVVPYVISLDKICAHHMNASHR